MSPVASLYSVDVKCAVEIATLHVLLQMQALLTLCCLTNFK